MLKPIYRTKEMDDSVSTVLAVHTGETELGSPASTVLYP